MSGFAQVTCDAHAAQSSVPIPITTLGGVVSTSCQNVLSGDRLLVDMTTGVSQVEVDSGTVKASVKPVLSGMLRSDIGSAGHRAKAEEMMPKVVRIVTSHPLLVP
ncbi:MULTISPECIES: hypothetical protein [unclassified Bradyrhizobium]|uniref:hypothetical protein n=1 Tax=unclassified Bradyrhizobium TaxID=2631580 RepID=UPI00291653B4|nr:MULTISPECIES: hypothetical protein [unclassified Bradyrhizobium]